MANVTHKYVCYGRFVIWRHSLASSWPTNKTRGTVPLNEEAIFTQGGTPVRAQCWFVTCTNFETEASVSCSATFCSR